MTNVCPMVKLLSDNGLQIIFNISPELSVTSGSSQTATPYGCPGLVVKVWLIGQTSNDGASMSKNKQQSYMKIIGWTLESEGDGSLSKTMGKTITLMHVNTDSHGK